jgi:hypothetical protein
VVARARAGSEHETGGEHGSTGGGQKAGLHRDPPWGNENYDTSS